MNRDTLPFIVSGSGYYSWKLINLGMVRYLTVSGKVPYLRVVYFRELASTLREQWLVRGPSSSR